MWDANREGIYADDRIADANKHEERAVDPVKSASPVLSLSERRANDDILRVFGVGAQIEI